MLHENDAAKILCDMCINENMAATEVKEGKIELISKLRGYLHIDRDRLLKANQYDDISIATIKDGNVEEGEKIAGMRIIPLVIEKSKLEDVKKMVGDEPILSISPYVIKNFGIVATGSEICHFPNCTFGN